MSPVRLWRRTDRVWFWFFVRFVKFVFRWIQMTSDKLSYCGKCYSTRRRPNERTKDFVFVCRSRMAFALRFVFLWTFVAVTLCDVHAPLCAVLSLLVHRKWIAMHVDMTTAAAVAAVAAVAATATNCIEFRGFHI